MKSNRKMIVSLLIMVVVAALYRIIPGRPYGFAPQIAMALFGGIAIKDRKWSFLLPLLSMFISDAIYQLLYIQDLTPIKGFYGGMWINYLEIASVVFIGFLVKKLNLLNFVLTSVAAPTWFFIISNFTVWAGSDGTYLPKTAEGLASAYILGLPFYGASVLSTLVFGAIFMYAFQKVESREFSKVF